MNDYEIKKLYEQMEIHLIDSMKRNLGRHLNEEKEVGFKFTQWQAEKLKELKRYQRENKKIIGRYTLGLDKEVSEHLQNELKQGSINAIRQYNQALGKSLKPDKVMNKSFFKTNDKKVNNLIKVVNNDLKTANTSALRMINDQYRQIIHKSAFFVGNGVFTEKQAAAQAVKEISQKKLTTLAVDEASKNFLAGGLNCIEYSDGRRVNIASYSQMAIRTASIRSQLMGEGDFRKSIGRTLVKVTTHGGACPLCVKWQGQILIDDVYSGGTSKDGKYTLLSTAMKQGFLHPNCRHGITTYYPELEDDEASEETLQTSAEQEETQQKFNYAVRNVKKYRRLERGSLDRSNITKYRIKKDEWTNEAKQLDSKLNENTNNGKIFVEKLLKKYKGNNNKFIKAFENADLDDTSRKIIDNIEKLDDVEVKTGKKSYFKPVINELSIKGNLNGTVYHEWGHSIDYLVSRKINKDNNFEWISNSLEKVRNATKLKNKNSIPDNLVNIFEKQRERLKVTFKEEYIANGKLEEIIKRTIEKEFGSNYTNASPYLKGYIEKEVRQKELKKILTKIADEDIEYNQWAAVSDIYDAITDGSGYGSKNLIAEHGYDYWHTDSLISLIGSGKVKKQNAEIFADFVEMKLGNYKEQLKYLKDNEFDLYNELENIYKRLGDELDKL